MNIKLQKLITLFNERKNFFNNHPDAYRFMLDNFQDKLPVGTELDISVKRPSGKAESVRVIIDEKDKKFVDCISDVLKR